MYAVIKTGGKQYKVEPGDTLKVEKLDAEEGKTIKISDVLMVVDGDKVTVGTPYVKGTTVSAKVNAHGRGDKVNIIKFIRRKHHRRQMGHRQAYTELSILDIKTK
jgi:ribosomal protein L21